VDRVVLADGAAVDLAAVELAAVDLAAVDLAAVDLAAVDLAAVDLAAVDLADGTAGAQALGGAHSPSQHPMQYLLYMLNKDKVMFSLDTAS
jgi:uncharacterized protein YjbI with pentapeptide repeats